MSASCARLGRYLPEVLLGQGSATVTYRARAVEPLSSVDAQIFTLKVLREESPGPEMESRFIDLGEVGRARKLGLRRGARGGAGRGFAGNSEVVENLAYRLGFSDGGQNLHAPLALRACQRVCQEHPFQKDCPR